MAGSNNWLPTKREDAILMAKAWQGLFSTKATDWAIPPATVTAFTGLVTAADTAVETVIAEKSPHNVEAARLAVDALTSQMRFIKGHYFLVPPLTPTDFTDLLLKQPDSTRTPAPPPSTIPAIKLDSSIIRQISVHFRDSGSDKRGKPQGVHGIELRWSFLETPPASVDDLKNSAFDTASPYTFAFDEADRGKSLYICPRWEGNKADKGPWGEIEMAIIP